jgi:hypothetical protein
MSFSIDDNYTDFRSTSTQIEPEVVTDHPLELKTADQLGAVGGTTLIDSVEVPATNPPPSTSKSSSAATIVRQNLQYNLHTFSHTISFFV